MLARVLLSDIPHIRKLAALYRFLSGHAGVRIDVNAEEHSAASNKLEQQKKHANKQSKKKGKKSGKSPSSPQPLAPIGFVSTDFVLNILIPSFDKLSQSVGTNMQYE